MGLSNDYYEDLQESLVEVQDEVIRAKGNYDRDFASQHEGYAVIKEEVEELWDEIKKNERNYDLAAQRKEAIQAAAMLMRFIVELTPIDRVAKERERVAQLAKEYNEVYGIKGGR